MSKSAILCVDDEETVLNSLKDQLRIKVRNEHNIETAENGKEALELLHELLEEKLEIPLIIADYIMPGMRGDELLKCVHAITPQTVKVLLTGQATTEGVTNAVNYANLFRFIAKPWDREQLYKIVTEAIQKFNNHKQLEQKQQEYLEMLEEKAMELSSMRERLAAAEKMAALGQMAVSAASELYLPLLSVKSNLEQEKTLREGLDLNNSLSLRAYLEKVKQLNEDNTPVLDQTIQVTTQLKTGSPGR